MAKNANPTSVAMVQTQSHEGGRSISLVKLLDTVDSVEARQGNQPQCNTFSDWVAL
ncbi:hypothetical protein BAUCODRAFT_33459 [Baudoinia panamericana UAMH 10762]|uniref:Uncharacterized protein n=1 Tax=Baudoinia panamericana (strain UAMH 10762) TaxID=717646 RepID=M2NEQ7_BAUPA|nr:uncharacterized protein BAUCODRAFT_33459 [Baudoinia panamericana UAMH 10762]EMC97734.1 hypothetical protein BAUCODRAFT_33459 [Baudoinia panamericana UAMH 10762]